MKIWELNELTEYEIGTKRSYSKDRAILLSKTMEPPFHEQGRIRKVAMAVYAGMGYPQKLVTTERSVWTGTAYEMKPFTMWTTDYEAERVETWTPKWVPLSHILRTWDEAEEEKAIEDEIKRQRQEAHAAAQKEREDRISAETDKLQGWFDEMLPELGLKFNPGYSEPELQDGYQYRQAQWWRDTFIPAINKKLGN